jgi:ABC transporter substrate binding protein (PQQ-dependent alcohol dehydrogenase system)
MTEAGPTLLRRRGWLAAAAALAAAPAWAQPPHTFLLGLLTQADDERYSAQALLQGYPDAPAGRSAPAAQLALDDVAFTLQGAGYSGARLLALQAANAAAVPGALAQLLRQGVHHVVLELPAAGVAAAAAAAKGKDVLLFNAAAPDDALRAAQCAPNLLHTLPSRAMQTDALVQLLAARRWGKVLVLTGPTPADRLLQAAFQRSARKFGVKPLAEKSFKLSNDPRERDLGNIRLLTAERDYDAVVVLDADGEFAREVPYRTVLPRPVLGSNGLTAQAWSFFHERNGAPQLNHRFQRKADRPMGSYDWATWMAARAAAEVASANPKADIAHQLKALRDGTLAFDGYKGQRLSFRAWDGQLRQPLLLAYGNGVAEIAPLPGFLHQRTVLDTLGFDAPETGCKSP